MFICIANASFGWKAAIEMYQAYVQKKWRVENVYVNNNNKFYYYRQKKKWNKDYQM